MSILLPDWIEDIINEFGVSRLSYQYERIKSFVGRPFRVALDKAEALPYM
jgi:hypothetical protein